MHLFNSNLKFKIFLFSKLPIAWLAGLKKKELTTEKAIISVKYGFWNKNPFNSMYFAVEAMAAEMSSGILVLSHVGLQKASISTLVLGMQAEFSKKAIGTIQFVCEDGVKIKQIIEETAKSSEAKTFDSQSIGYNMQGEVVAKFIIRWTFKSRK